jgi:hypothetical protein
MNYDLTIGIAEVLSLFGVSGGIFAFYTMRTNKKQLEANVFTTLQASYETLIKTLQERLDRHGDLIDKLEIDKQNLKKMVCFDNICKKRKT